jgi:hypothetical protein
MPSRGGEHGCAARDAAISVAIAAIIFGRQQPGFGSGGRLGRNCGGIDPGEGANIGQKVSGFAGNSTLSNCGALGPRGESGGLLQHPAGEKRESRLLHQFVKEDAELASKIGSVLQLAHFEIAKRGVGTIPEIAHRWIAAVAHRVTPGLEHEYLIKISETHDNRCSVLHKRFLLCGKLATGASLGAHECGKGAVRGRPISLHVSTLRGIAPLCGGSIQEIRVALRSSAGSFQGPVPA